jgi:hypothetical protein
MSAKLATPAVLKRNVLPLIVLFLVIGNIVLLLSVIAKMFSLPAVASPDGGQRGLNKRALCPAPSPGFLLSRHQARLRSIGRRIPQRGVLTYTSVEDWNKLGKGGVR